MRYIHRRHRVDGNTAEIVKAARAVGFIVYPRNDALADLDVQLAGRHEIWECKNGGKLSKRQQEMREAGWKVRLVSSVEDVLKARKEMA